MKVSEKNLFHRIHVYWSLFNQNKLDYRPRAPVSDISDFNIDRGTGQEFHNMEKKSDRINNQFFKSGVKNPVSFSSFLQKTQIFS